MTASARRGALAALDAARPAIARLDGSRHPEDVAADLIESWSAVENALREILGVQSASLSGQSLIREARQRQMLGFNEANALAEFHAASDRSQHTDYKPTSVDIDAARDGFLKLEAQLLNEAAPTPVAGGGKTEGATRPAVETPKLPSPLAQSSGDRRRWLGWAVGAVVAVAIIVTVVVVLSNRRPAALDRAVREYQSGQREAAVADFNQAVRERPNDALPHIYLSRMAREVGNLPMSQQEASAGVQADPRSEPALREMGAYLLTVGNYDLARRFYIRALQLDTTDKVALGYLGCSLAKLGRADEAERWFTRAGSGPWTGCTAGSASAKPGASSPPIQGSRNP